MTQVMHNNRYFLGLLIFIMLVSFSFAVVVPNEEINYIYDGLSGSASYSSLINYEGVSIFQATGESGGSPSTPTLCDVDNDGYTEVIGWENVGGNLSVYNYANNELTRSVYNIRSGSNITDIACVSYYGKYHITGIFESGNSTALAFYKYNSGSDSFTKINDFYDGDSLSYSFNNRKTRLSCKSSGNDFRCFIGVDGTGNTNLKKSWSGISWNLETIKIDMIEYYSPKAGIRVYDTSQSPFESPEDQAKRYYYQGGRSISENINDPVGEFNYIYISDNLNTIYYDNGGERFAYGIDLSFLSGDYPQDSFWSLLTGEYTENNDLIYYPPYQINTTYEFDLTKGDFQTVGQVSGGDIINVKDSYVGVSGILWTSSSSGIISLGNYDYYARLDGELPTTQYVNISLGYSSLSGGLEISFAGTSSFYGPINPASFGRETPCVAIGTHYEDTPPLTQFDHATLYCDNVYGFGESYELNTSQFIIPVAGGDINGLFHILFYNATSQTYSYANSQAGSWETLQFGRIDGVLDFETNAYGHFALADLDGDQESEVIVVNDNSVIVAYRDSLNYTSGTLYSPYIYDYYSQDQCIDGVNVTYKMKECIGDSLKCTYNLNTETGYEKLCSSCGGTQTYDCGFLSFTNPSITCYNLTAGTLNVTFDLYAYEFDNTSTKIGTVSKLLDYSTDNSTCNPNEWYVPLPTQGGEDAEDILGNETTSSTTSDYSTPEGLLAGGNLGTLWKLVFGICIIIGITVTVAQYQRNMSPFVIGLVAVLATILVTALGLIPVYILILIIAISIILIIMGKMLGGS